MGLADAFLSGLDRAETSQDVKLTIEALKKARLKRRESNIVGKLLAELFELEGALDECIATLIDPKESRFRKVLADELLCYVPIRNKLKFAASHGLLDEKTVSKIQTLFDRRNDLAHRRPIEKRLGRILTNSAVDSFVEECQRSHGRVLDATIRILKNFQREKAESEKQATFEALRRVSGYPPSS